MTVTKDLEVSTRTSGPRWLLVWVLSIGYGAFVAVVAFWPSPVDAPIVGLLERIIQELHERGVPGFVNYAFIEFTANIAFFVPIGVLFGLALPLRWWPLMYVAGPVLSVGIELIQRVLLSARYATVADVIANSIGATLGVTLAVALRLAIARRDARVIARYAASSRVTR